MSDLQPIANATLATAAVGNHEEVIVNRLAVTRSFSLMLHFRRLAVLTLTVSCRTWIPFLLLGAINRVFPMFGSVFFCYAGNERYARHYGYRFSREFQLWFPTIIGIFRQGKKWGLICASNVTEAEFTDPGKAIDFGLLVRRLRCVKAVIGVHRLSFAGILPTVLDRKWPESTEHHDYTAEVVRKAIEDVQTKHFKGRPPRLVLLGGAGRIGRAVYEILKSEAIDPVVIDPAIPPVATFQTLSPDEGVLVIDVSRHGVIDRYVKELPEGSVVLNEVFPEPRREVLAQLKKKLIATYHIAGVTAQVYPPLPLGYENALPCCAIHSADIGKPILKRIA
jgi:hypothetical protein